jgi:hypothetical protein
MIVISSFGVLISTAELISLTTDHAFAALLRPDGLRRIRWLRAHPSVLTQLQALASPPRIRFFFAFRIGCALLCIIFAGSTAVGTFLFLLVGSQLLLNVYLVTGADGSDQMTTIVLTALLLGLVIGIISPVAQAFCLYFIAAQACLAYFTSGVAKLISPEWRDGTALHAIADTHFYGNAAESLFFTKYVGTALIASWFIMLFQITFPLSLLLPYPWNLTYLGLGVWFHVAVAILMSLNLFIPAFIATYPALMFVNQQLSTFLSSH